MNSVKNFSLPPVLKTFCLRPLPPLLAVLDQFYCDGEYSQRHQFSTHGGFQHGSTKRQRRDNEAYSSISTDLETYIFKEDKTLFAGLFVSKSFALETN